MIYTSRLLLKKDSSQCKNVLKNGKVGNLIIYFLSYDNSENSTKIAKEN